MTILSEDFKSQRKIFCQILDIKRGKINSLNNEGPGISIWSQPIPNDLLNNNIYFLFVNGLNLGLGQSSDVEKRLFALVTFISSYLIINVESERTNKKEILLNNFPIIQDFAQQFVQ